MVHIRGAILGAFFIVVTIAVVGIMGIIAWIGWTRATTPPPESIEALEEKVSFETGTFEERKEQKL